MAGSFDAGHLLHDNRLMIAGLRAPPAGWRMAALSATLQFGRRC